MKKKSRMGSDPLAWIQDSRQPLPEHAAGAPELEALAARIVALDPGDIAEWEALQDPLSSWASGDRTEEEQRLVQQALAILDRVRGADEHEREQARDELAMLTEELQAEHGASESAAVPEETAEGGEPGEAPEPEFPSAGEPKSVGDAGPEPAGDTEPPAEDLEFSLELDPVILREFITESMDHLQSVEANVLHLETNPDDPERLNALFRAFHSTKGTANFLGLTHVRDLAHHAETLLDRAREGDIRLTGRAADLALEAADTLRSMILALTPMVEGGPRPAPPAALPFLNSRLETYQENAEGQTACADSGPETSDPEEECNRKVARESAEGTIRVSLRRMDNLINMIGELVIMHAMIAQDPALASQGDHTALGRNVMRLGKITRNLQDLGMSMRMVPLRSTFQKMERAARDLARKSGKSIRFLTEGDDTEIDRNLVESISDPLVHMIRNAVDHGIESLADRAKAGKPEAGMILLRAHHSAGNVVIEIRDDGKGLDRARILEKAVERNLAEPGAELSDSDIHKFIFSPGFSTAEKVTDVSGRGVGMDVVKKNLEAMHGRVDVSSIPGQSTTFTVRIPLTLAIIDGLLFRVGSELFLVPTLNVKQAFRPAAGTVSTVQGKGEMVLLRDHLIPVFRLQRLFNLPEAIQNPYEAMLLVVEHENRLCALLTDELLGQQQVVIKTLGTGMGQVKGIAGAAILGDGKIRLIIDVAGVLALAHGRDESADLNLG